MRTTRPDVIANNIRMLRSQFSGVFLLVEGRDDRLLCEKVISKDACRVKTIESKTNVLETINILNNNGFAGVLGVVDPDYDRMLKIERSVANIVTHDEHDLEAMLVKHNALEHVLIEVGSPSKIEDLGATVRDRLIEAARPIGALRLHSLRERLDLTFKGLQYSQFVDRDTMHVDRSRLIASVKNLSQRPDLDPGDLQRIIDRVLDQSEDDWQLCCGTDLIGILSHGLRRAVGSNNPQEVTPERLHRMLRLAISPQEFGTSGLAREIRKWQDSDVGVEILRCP